MIETFADARGIVLRRDVVAALGGDHLVTRAMRSGRIVRVRQGAYCLPPIWDAAGPAERHRLTAHAVRRQYGDDVALSHVSAHLEAGGPDHGLPLDVVHLTSLAGVGDRTQAGIAHHRGGLRVGDLRRDEHGWITTPVRTALDSASLAPRDAAICVLDWTQQTERATREELEAALGGMHAWPDTLALEHRLAISCGKCESVGETLTHLLCRDHGLPTPVPQFDVRHPDGRVAGRVDFAWPELGALLEFDGLAKYQRLRREGESVTECVVREKAREDLLRRLTGWPMMRIVWVDLSRPKLTAGNIGRFLRQVAA